MFVYVGSRTTVERNARGKGISIFHCNESNGHLELVSIVRDLVNPSFFTLNRRGDRLYCVHGDTSDVSAFAVDKAEGSLTFINRQSCAGKNPVHLALDNTEQHLVVSNHITGTLAVMGVGEQGELLATAQLVSLEGQPGPHRVEQPFAKPHFNIFDPAGQFVVVPDKGLDRIFSYQFVNGHLLPARVPHVDTREGAGPRHIVFHPVKAYAYAVNELDSTVTFYQFDQHSGALLPMQTLPSLPDRYTGNSRASEIEVSASGRFLYVSNRGYDSIGVFAIDSSGFLTPVQFEPTRGKTPRYFCLSPDNRFLFSLNEDSDSITLFDVDESTGSIFYTDKAFFTESPVCMLFGK
ncbi:hemagglutinin [Pokkaliibacter plantistimulans]|uniref:Hemagglutinin n=1 Tax=Proteobacteria bacterium 228 TaxID=2083153 RepID=A0A2S5KGT8_9PROT|nr:lactonase family protein [Pokkaliibacter plantistimulans]PPC74021.1 hemagglutinin [Pokkaliibacter plantistimulans]